MAANLEHFQPSAVSDRKVVVAAALMSIPLLLAIVFLAVADRGTSAYPYLSIAPWAMALGAFMAAPSAWLYYRGKFSFADPLVFATWTYFVPAFVVGGLFFSIGWSDPAFIALVDDVPYTLPLTLGFVALGFGGLALGNLLPMGDRVGSAIAAALPTVDYQPSSLILPGTVLLLFGAFNTIAAVILGVFGYQRLEERGALDGAIFMTTLFWVQGFFLLCLVLFKQKSRISANLPLLALLVFTALGKVLLAGSRSTVAHILLIVVLAYVLSGRKFRLRQGVVVGVAIVIGAIAGMVYGSYFRIVKGGEAAQGADLYVGNVVNTIDEIGRAETVDSLAFGLTSLAERVDIATTLAVVVSNYEKLAPYEEAYGLDNNIWIDSTTFFIPRAFWADKPNASDPRRYSELYFNFGESSFAITSIGDLLRNFGPVGVFLGMFLLGFVLRCLYRGLVYNQPMNPWRVTLYFMLMTAVSYEGFFGGIMPNMFRTGILSLTGILIIGFMANRKKSRELAR